MRNKDIIRFLDEEKDGSKARLNFFHIDRAALRIQLNAIQSAAYAKIKKANPDQSVLREEKNAQEPVVKEIFLLLDKYQLRLADLGYTYDKNTGVLSFFKPENTLIKVELSKTELKDYKSSKKTDDPDALHKFFKKHRLNKASVDLKALESDPDKVIRSHPFIVDGKRCTSLLEYRAFDFFEVSHDKFNQVLNVRDKNTSPKKLVASIEVKVADPQAITHLLLDEMPCQKFLTAKLGELPVISFLGKIQEYKKVQIDGILPSPPQAYTPYLSGIQRGTVQLGQNPLSLDQGLSLDSFSQSYPSQPNPYNKQLNLLDAEAAKNKPLESKAETQSDAKSGPSSSSNSNSGKRDASTADLKGEANPNKKAKTESRDQLTTSAMLMQKSAKSLVTDIQNSDSEINKTPSPMQM